MKKVFLVACCWLLVTGLSAQTVTEKLQKAFQKFEADSQLKHAISSLYVIDAATGQVVFDKNSQIGLAGASTQKIITAASAFELLGKEYRYKTEFVMGKDLHTIDQWWMFVKASGDPTFGSWRFTGTKDSIVFRRVFEGLQNRNPKMIWIVDEVFGTASIPDGWIWQDIGNYYGASPFLVNWKENQYEVLFDSHDVGEATGIVKIGMDTSGLTFYNEVKAGHVGSGDNAYIYSTPYSNRVFIRGTIPPNQKSFSISGSVPDPALNFSSDLKLFLMNKSNKIINPQTYVFRSTRSHNEILGTPSFGTFDTIYTHYSPSLDSIIYWFLKKSINLYGEALVKTFAYEKQGFGSTDSGVNIVKKFWKDKGLDEDELNIYDGSGLSPQNRITTHAQVEVLKYAKTRDWFPNFYDALPEFNSMKMKSGTISDVKGFCGYQKAKDGKEYIFSFLVNNYNGKTSGVVNKMYKVLDELK
ncbi:MAG TPA: D-alanyl-D-alanine carboxypeptidase/D-alanyl-D-alanine-endopeptidase [Chitinophagaceae bacterium]|nr:D-alanyl-D-alanine carboxypeptidase/D-alanyl-D-alanine-endopeptidase [Chitinophagaceae bacterium]